MKANGFREVALSAIRFSEKLALRDGAEYSDETKLDALSKSIQNSGQIQPIVVRELDDGTYELVAGHRRVYAMLAKARKDGSDPKIIVKVVPSDLSFKEILGIAVEENAMRKDFSTDEMLRVVNLMDEAGYSVDTIAEKTGQSKKTVERMLRVVRDKYFHKLVKTGTLKYTQANALLSGTPNDKLEMLKSTVKRWKAATDKKIEAARERMASSGKTPSGPRLQHSTYLPSWLVDNWLLAIGEGREPQVDGEWRYGLLHDPEKRLTNIPAIKVNYDRDSLDRLVDISWKLRKEIERLDAAIESRKLQQEAVSDQPEYGDDYQEFLRSKGLEKFGRKSAPAPDAEIPDLDDSDNDDDDEEHLDDVEDFLDSPDSE
ncbi:MAG: ParB/RepB/Spo0J family partition protein [Deltaproteobacteria bacterium]|nr:ParB/RepB/Spo0J family partition protein [Deltaproteobacteria bacterium]